MKHDRIEKQVLLKAPLERVWRAISDSRRFGAWFGMEVEGGFVAGTRVRAKIRPTQVDAAVAEMQKPYDGVTFDLWIERVEPMRCFAFRYRFRATGTWRSGRAGASSRRRCRRMHRPGAPAGCARNRIR